MTNIVDYPLPVFVAFFIAMWLAIRAGVYLRMNRRDLSDAERDDFSVVRGAILTLLGLIVGFSFSMAVGRYDQRKIFEEAEANAIGTE